jgi:hypothetical protein
LAPYSTHDSGDGNPLSYSGAISGGDVVLLVGPSHTDCKAASGGVYWGKSLPPFFPVGKLTL